MTDNKEECTHEFVTHEPTYCTHCAACGKYLGEDK